MVREEQPHSRGQGKSADSLLAFAMQLGQGLNSLFATQCRGKEAEPHVCIQKIEIFAYESLLKKAMTSWERH